MPDSPQLSLGILLSDNMLRLIPILECAFASAGLSVSCAQYRLLTYLADAKPKILNDVAEFFSRDKSMMMRHVDHLQTCGYITREVDSNDQRRKCLVLTSSGRTALNKARKIEKNIYTKLLKGRSETEMSTLYDLLAQISERVEELK